MNNNNDITHDFDDELIGNFVGNYKVLSLIGSGAFGDVYLAKHPTIESKVAIKILDADVATNTEMVKRFIDEARAVNLINHPNIIQIYDFGQLPDGRHYYTMEYLDGEELNEIINRDAPLTIKETAIILKQIAQGLSAAHEHGIIHRDLKPENILVKGRGEDASVKILDFGIAKLLGADIRSKYTTQKGVVMGTPRFMSPEQASGSLDEISAASDIYSLAVIVYKMLSDEYPIDAETPRELLYKQVSSPPVPLEKVTSGLPEELCIAVNRALSKNPKDRFQDAMDFFMAFKNGADLVDEDFISMISEHTGEIPQLPKSAFDELENTQPKRDLLGTLGFWGLMFLLVGAAAGGGFIIWKKTITLLNTEESSSVSKQAISSTKSESKVKPVSKPKKPKIKTYEITLKAKGGSVRVDVYVNGKKKYKKRRTPFVFKEKKGVNILVRAYKKGYKVQEEAWIVDSPMEIVFSGGR